LNPTFATLRLRALALTIRFAVFALKSPFKRSNAEPGKRPVFHLQNALNKQLPTETANPE
jgi:hypothetical protein